MFTLSMIYDNCKYPYFQHNLETTPIFGDLNGKYLHSPPTLLFCNVSKASNYITLKFGGLPVLYSKILFLLNA
jgi:hypothetical protein